MRLAVRRCGSGCGRASPASLPGTQISFEAGDIVSQVMSFGSPTPIEVAVQGINLQVNSDYASKVRAQLAKLGFLRDLQFAQELNYPTLDIDIDRERAGQFGLDHGGRGAVGGSGDFVLAIHGSPNYWRDPASGNAFQIQVQLPQNQMQSIEEIGDLPVMRDGQRELQLTDIAGLKPGTMPGLIERYNGQRVVSLTANIHGITLGQAAARLNQALAAAVRSAEGRDGEAARRDSAARTDHVGIANRIAAGGAGDLSAAGGELSIDAAGAGDRADRSRRCSAACSDAARYRTPL